MPPFLTVKAGNSTLPSVPYSASSVTSVADPPAKISVSEVVGNSVAAGQVPPLIVPQVSRSVNRPVAADGFQ